MGRRKETAAMLVAALTLAACGEVKSEPTLTPALPFDVPAMSGTSTPAIEDMLTITTVTVPASTTVMESHELQQPGIIEPGEQFDTFHLLEPGVVTQIDSRNFLMLGVPLDECESFVDVIKHFQVTKPPELFWAETAMHKVLTEIDQQDSLFQPEHTMLLTNNESFKDIITEMGSPEHQGAATFALYDPLSSDLLGKFTVVDFGFVIQATIAEFNGTSASPINTEAIVRRQYSAVDLPGDIVFADFQNYWTQVLTRVLARQSHIATNPLTVLSPDDFAESRLEGERPSAGSEISDIMEKQAMIYSDQFAIGGDRDPIFDLR